MPDWGMWNMKFTKEEKLKLIERVWHNGEIKNKVCNSFGNFWYDGDTCPDCNVELDFDNAGYGAGTNGPTSGKAWGSPKRVKYCVDDWRKRRKKMPSRISKKEKAHLLNTAPAEEVLAFIRSRKSEFGQSKPMTRRQTIHVAGEKVDEGWVYIFKVYTYLENHPGVHWVYKIGKTYPDGISNRISESRTFARSDFIDKFWFEKAEMSEKEVHAILRRFNLRALGYTNCGKELFMCSLEQAVSAINEVEKIGNTKEQALG